MRMASKVPAGFAANASTACADDRHVRAVALQDRCGDFSVQVVVLDQQQAATLQGRSDQGQQVPGRRPHLAVVLLHQGLVIAVALA